MIFQPPMFIVALSNTFISFVIQINYVYCIFFYNNTNMPNYQHEQNQITSIISQILHLPRHIIAVIRLIPVFLLLTIVWITNQYLYPWIIIDALRRYIVCITNLICLRTALFLLGVTNINLSQFDENMTLLTQRRREVWNWNRRMPRKPRFGSGWVGVSNYEGLISILSFSCYCSPMYCKLVEYHEDACSCAYCNKQNKDEKNDKNKQSENKNIKLYYLKISVWSVILKGLDHSYFNPLIIKGKNEFRKCKTPPRTLRSLYNESSISLQGPILLFLPNIKFKSQLSFPKTLQQQMKKNTYQSSKNSLFFHINIDKKYRTIKTMFEQCGYLKSKQIDFQYRYFDVYSGDRLMQYYRDIHFNIDQYYSNKGYDIFKGGIPKFEQQAKYTKQQAKDESQVEPKNQKKEKKKGKNKKFTRSLR